MLDKTFDLIEKITDEPSKNKKIALIKKFDKTGKKVLQYAFDPFKTFGLASSIELQYLPEGAKVSSITPDEVFELLDKLANRELTGNAAIQAVEKAMSLSTHSQAWLIYHIIQKDLRCGISVSSCNKAFGKGFIPVFETMLAHKYDPNRVTAWPVYVEPKLDGMRAVAIVNTSGVRFVSRNGKSITSIPHLEKQIMNVFTPHNGGNLYIDGELTSGDNFNISISVLRKKDQVASEAKFHIFEVLTHEEFTGNGDTPFTERMKRIPSLNSQPNLVPVSRRTLHNDEEIIDYFNSLLNNGEEGVIVKNGDGIYEPKRSYNWMKIKDCNDADLEVVGVFEGQGKYEGQLGGLIVDHKGVEVRVGSGLSDEDRQDMWHIQDELIGLIAEVQYHEVTPDGSLRHPRFVRFRDDKDAS